MWRNGKEKHILHNKESTFSHDGLIYYKIPSRSGENKGVWSTYCIGQTTVMATYDGPLPMKQAPLNVKFVDFGRSARMRRVWRYISVHVTSNNVQLTGQPSDTEERSRPVYNHSIQNLQAYCRKGSHTKITAVSGDIRKHHGRVEWEERGEELVKWPAAANKREWEILDKDVD